MKGYFPKKSHPVMLALLFNLLPLRYMQIYSWVPLWVHQNRFMQKSSEWTDVRIGSKTFVHVLVLGWSSLSRYIQQHFITEATTFRSKDEARPHSYAVGSCALTNTYSISVGNELEVHVFPFYFHLLHSLFKTKFFTGRPTDLVKSKKKRL